MKPRHYFYLSVLCFATAAVFNHYNPNNNGPAYLAALLFFIAGMWLVGLAMHKASHQKD